MKIDEGVMRELIRLADEGFKERVKAWETESRCLRKLMLAADIETHWKQIRFEQDDGQWYSRESCATLSLEDAVDEICAELYRNSER